LKFRGKNHVWTRIENVDRTNELLLGENQLPSSFSEGYFTRVQGSTLGYDREFGSLKHVSTALAGQFTGYGGAEYFEADLRRSSARDLNFYAGCSKVAKQSRSCSRYFVSCLLASLVQPGRLAASN